WLLKVDDRGCLEPGCEDDLIITDIEAVGEENIADGSRILLYPNPATEQTTVYFKKQLATNAVLEVYDALGRWRQRYDLRAFQERQVLDLEGLELGAYLCVLKVEGKVVDKVRFLNKNS
ncbi:MAG: T9SS type A sorting domain-containing protein, partial [Chitinophagales bacterium]